jgi:hypothetical protein
MAIAAAVKPKVTKAEDKRAGWAIAIFATVAALLSGVGIGTGDVGHVLSNETGPAIATFALVTVASLLGIIAGWFTDKPSREHWLIRVSAILLAPAVGTALWTGIAFARERPEPSITAGISGTSGHRELRFEVKDSGLRSKDSMIIKVQALTEVRPTDKTATPLYTAALGPGSDGSIDHVGEVPVPPAPASDVEVQAWVNTPQTCYKKKVTVSTGCTTVHLTRLFERPQLTIAWRNPRHSASGLFIAVTARDIAQHRVLLRVVDADRHRAVLVATWPASETGNVDKAVTAIIPRSVGKVCVAASTTESRPDCAAHLGTGDASVITAVPMQ